MEVSSLGINRSLIPAAAMKDPSHLFDLHHSSQQHQILNPLSEAVKPGIEPASWWLLVGFISTAPQQELPDYF